MKSRVVGRRRGDEEEKCCKCEQVEAELSAGRWAGSAGISTMRRGLCRAFREDVFKALKRSQRANSVQTGGEKLQNLLLDKSIGSVVMDVPAGALGSPVFDQGRAVGRWDRSWKSLFLSVAHQALELGSKEHSGQPSVFSLCECDPET